jgi:hypothetical protein
VSRNPFEEVEFTAEETAIIDHWLSTGQPRPTYPATACKVRESTPITAEGLRGLGMTDDGLCYAYRAKFSGHRATVELAVKESGTTFAIQDEEVILLGTAPDIETVGRLIEVLRRMNGGGA